MEQLPLENDDDDDEEMGLCSDEISQSTDTNFPTSQMINRNEVQNNVDFDWSKDVQMEDVDDTSREVEGNENGYDSELGTVQQIEGVVSEEADIIHEDDIKSEIFENSQNTHVVVLNKYNKFNARTKPDRSTLKHECDICDEAFQFPYQLARHKTVKHEGKFPYFCDICKKPFDRSSSLRDHMHVHSDKRPYECKQCEKTFKMIGNLRKHIRDTHAPEEEPKLVFQCEYCSKVFPTKERLTSHFLVHETEKAFACSVCGKKFNRKSNLKEHIVIHSAEKNYVCPDCGMRFSRKYSLKIHARNHMEVKPYKCELCPSSFSQLHALKTHFRLHTGEKPFKCNVCEKTFRQLATLQVHVKRHTGVKDFFCGICGKGFIIKRRLIEHERLHTGEKPFSCDICPYHAATSSGLRLHKKTHKRQMERLGIDSIEELLIDGKQSISTDGRKRKVSNKIKLPKQPAKVTSDQPCKVIPEEPCTVINDPTVSVINDVLATVMHDPIATVINETTTTVINEPSAAVLHDPTATFIKKESVEVEDLVTRTCYENKSVLNNFTDREEIKDKNSFENESLSAELTFVQSGHVIEMVNDVVDPYTPTIPQNDYDCPDNNNDDDNERITNDVRNDKNENNSPETVIKEGHVVEFENIATEVLYKYLNELIPAVDADLLTEKINSIVEELSETHTKLLKEKAIKDRKKTKNKYDTNNKRKKDVSKTSVKGNKRHISKPTTELSQLTRQSLSLVAPDSESVNVCKSPLVDVLNSPTVNVRNSPLFDVPDTPTVNVCNSSLVNVLNSPSINVRNSALVNVLNSPSVNVRNSALVNVLNSPSINVRNSALVNVLNSPSINVRNSALVNVLNSPSVNVRNSPLANVLNSPSVNDRNLPLVDVGQSPSANVGKSLLVNVSAPSSRDFSSISKQTDNAGTKVQGHLQSHDNKSIFQSSTLRKMLASKEPMIQQANIVRNVVTPVCTKASNSFTVLKDILSAPPQHYLTSTRNSSAALKHSIKRQKLIASSNSSFGGKWHTPDSAWSKSSFTWIDESECPESINIKQEPVSP